MPYTSTTLADLTVSLQQRWDGVVFWTPEEARIALNETLRDWNLLTGRWRRRILLSPLAPIATVPQTDLTLPATMVYGMRLALVTGTPLIPTSILELDLARPTWRRETTTSGGDVPTRPTLWAPISLLQVAIWPASAVLLTNGLAVDGVSNTPVLVEPGDTVDIGEEIQDVLLDMALHIAAFKEGGPRWRATTGSFQAFLVAAAAENGLLKRNQKFRRWAGLDRRRDLQNTKDAANKLAEVVKEFGPGGSA